MALQTVNVITIQATPSLEIGKPPKLEVVIDPSVGGGLLEAALILQNAQSQVLHAIAQKVQQEQSHARKLILANGRMPGVPA